MFFATSSIDIEAVTDAGDCTVFEDPESISAVYIAAVFMGDIWGRSWNLLAAMVVRYKQKTKGVTWVQSSKRHRPLSPIDPALIIFHANAEVFMKHN